MQNFFKDLFQSVNTPRADCYITAINACLACDGSCHFSCDQVCATTGDSGNSCGGCNHSCQGSCEITCTLNCQTWLTSK